MSMIIVIDQLWWAIVHLFALSVVLVYIALGARVLTFAVMNRVPLKIAPDWGEWAVQIMWTFFLWPVGLWLQPDLRPALQSMNRRDRDRLAMQREVQNAQDAVNFAAQKAAHRAEMDRLAKQKREMEEHETRLAITTAQSNEDQDEDEDEAEIVEPELGLPAQELLHKAQYSQNPERYCLAWGIKKGEYPYEHSFLRRGGCYHNWIPELIECTVCSPVHHPRKK
jgi:hypothetical protein